MGNYFLLPIGLLFSFYSYGQKADTVWLNSKWEKGPKEGSSYYRITKASADSSNYAVTDFFVTGEVQMTGTYKSLIPQVKHGEFNYYYKNGTKRYQFLYSNDSTKKSKEWDAQGKLIKQQDIVETISNNDGKESREFKSIEVMPEFSGGLPAVYQFIGKNFKYPAGAPLNIKGKIIVSFVINTKGRVVDTKIFQSLDPLLDEEAMRVVRSMPKWNPGIQDGKLVNVMMRLPININ